MARIESILQKARYSLADPSKERYSDERLLDAISEGQRDIARQTRLLKDEIDVVLNLAQPIYSLPSDLWLITRASFDNEPIPLMSYDRMDAEDCSWYTRFGNKVEALVYDKRNMHEIRVYPRPDSTYTIETYSIVPDNPLVLDPNGLTAEQLQTIHDLIAQLGILDTQNPLPLSLIYSAAGSIIDVQPSDNNTSPVFGVVTSVDGITPQSMLGVLTGMSLESDYKSWPGEVEFTSPFGVVTDMSVTMGLLHINYIKDPAPIRLVTDELLVSPIFDTALKYYVLAQAFSDDLDSQYQAKAGDAMAMYQRELQTVGYPTDETDGTRATQYTPNYTGPFGN
jgi:hypothetical protein